MTNEMLKNRSEYTRSNSGYFDAYNKEVPDSLVHDTFPSQAEAKGSFEGSQSTSPTKDN